MNLLAIHWCVNEYIYIFGWTNFVVTHLSWKCFLAFIQSLAMIHALKVRFITLRFIAAVCIWKPLCIQQRCQLVSHRRHTNSAAALTVLMRVYICMTDSSNTVTVNDDWPSAVMVIITLIHTLYNSDTLLFTQTIEMMHVWVCIPF